MDGCQDCLYAAMGLPLLVLSLPIGAVSMLFCGCTLSTPCMNVTYPTIWQCCSY